MPFHLDIDMGTASRIYGVLATSPAALRAELARITPEHLTLDNYTALSVTMPCGQVQEWRTLAEIPEQDVPCACGDPTHICVGYGAI